MFVKRGPRKTSLREVSEKSVSFHTPVVTEAIDVMAILAQRHPEKGEDYAIQLWCKSNKHNPFFKVQSKQLDEDMETATLVVNNQAYKVNIRTGIIVKP
jgi:hypothetical protein